MKIIYTTVFLIFTSLSLQAQFGPAQLINSPTDLPNSKQYIRTADIDGDGKIDILVGGRTNDNVRYFHNQGNLTFDSTVLLPGTWLDLQSIETSDLNNNGKPDLVTLDVQAKKLFWHPNINGLFPQQVLITSNILPQSGRILCDDFNGDGNKDIVILSGFNAILFLNDGAGNFSTPQNILAPADEEEVYDNVTGDFNNDGFLDISLAVGGFIIMINDGAGNFTKIVGGSTDISFLLESADYNNDSLDDILIAGHTLVPYQNSLTGFSEVGAFSPNNENYQTIFSSDLDNDGDLDLISENDQNNALFWYENVAGGSSWIRHNLITGNLTPSTIYGVRAADLDGDGDNDLIRSSSNGEVAIYENQLFLSIVENEKSNFTIFPNPTSDFLTITGDVNSSFDLQVCDLLGKVILIKNNATTNSQIDITGIKSGNYLLKIIEENRVEVKKIMIFR